MKTPASPHLNSTYPPRQLGCPPALVRRFATAAVLIASLLASRAGAEIIYGMTIYRELITFDSGDPSNITSTVPITGLTDQDNFESVRAIDFRPATEELYGVGNAPGGIYRLYKIDPATGVAAQVGSNLQPVPASFGFNFEPTTDRIRIVSDAEHNLRYNPADASLVSTDGSIAYSSSDPGAGTDPNVVTVSYTNSVPAAGNTTLYVIDTARDVLATQDPNTGVLTTIGPLGMDVPSFVNPAALEISPITGAAYLTVNNPGAQTTMLYTINLQTGAATLVGEVGTNAVVRSITTPITEPTPPPTPTPPAEPRIWVAGRDLAEYERTAAAAGANTVIPQWSYGYRTTINSTDLTLFTPAEHTDAERNRPAVQGWTSSSGAVVVANTSSTPEQYFAGSTPYTLLPDQMLIRKNLSTGAMPVVRWTAPSEGSYKMIAKWHDLSPTTQGGVAHVVINGTQVFGRQDNNAFIGQEWGNRGNAMMPTQTFYLRAGDVVDFVLGTRGLDSFTDDTGFAAAITRVATVSVSTPAAEYLVGEDVPVSVQVDHKLAIAAVKLLINGLPAPVAEDATAPYEFILPDVEAGTYYLTAVARDESDAEAASDGITLIDPLTRLQPFKIVVNKGGSAAAARAERSAGSNAADAASAGGVTYRCTQSGEWNDPTTWGGIGVPGKNDDAIIPQGFQVTHEDVSGAVLLEIDNLELSGRLVSNRGVVVHGRMQASGSVVGFTDDEFVLTIDAGATFSNVAGPAVFENVIFTNYGTVILGQDGGINGSGTSFVNSGTFKVLPAPGSNRPTVALLRGVEMKGGLISVGPYTHLITTGATGIVAAGAGNIVAAGAGNIVAAGAGNLIGADGASLIGADGASLVGMDGASIVAAGAGNIVAAGAGNLIGFDGGSIVAAGAGNFAGRPVSSKTGTPARFETVADAGTISLGGGTVSGNLNLVGNVSNTGAFISPGNSAGKMRITGNYTQESGGTLLLEIGGTGTSPILQYDQLQITGSANLGGNLIVKTIDGFTPQSGDTFSPLTYASATGNFASVTSNAQVSLGPNGMTMQVSGPNPPAPKALNIATRMRVEAGDNTLIAGFIITGPSGSTKKVMIRGIGPSLGAFGVPGTLPDPLLELHSGGSPIVNDNWKSGDTSQIPPGFSPSDDREAVIVATLTPGNYTAVLKGAHGETGVALAEVYDLDSASAAQLANISTRGLVQTDDNVMIGGFILDGNRPAKILVRVTGPTLANFGLQGILENPTLELHDSNGGSIGNDNWRETQEAEIQGTNIAPSHEREPAILATLVPGHYTAVVRGKSNTTGIAVVEAYNFQ